MLSIGLDIGSTTIKSVVLDENGKIVYDSYERHFSDVQNKATALLTKIKDEFKLSDSENIKICISGSAGMGFAEDIGFPFVQEVYATRTAVLKNDPETDAVIELGGEDAKILFLTGEESGEKELEVRMNGSCAGGTGAFIDQMATLLGITPDEMDIEAKSYEKLYVIASRCGVFAKSDIQPLLNQGARIPDISASIFYAVVNQTVAGLAQGRIIKGNVLYLGGPLTFHSQLRSAFDKTLGITGVCPENSLCYVALGAALSQQKKTYSIGEAISAVKDRKTSGSYKSTEPLFESEEEYKEFLERHSRDTVEKISPEEVKGGVYLGIDAGSTTLKCAVTDEEGRLVHSVYMPNSGNPVPLVRDFLKDFYTKYPSLSIKASASTGYGEEIIKNAFGIDMGVVETVAHFSAARHFKPEVDFILDIGGQDIKCFKIANGAIDNIFLNEACSSGCGSFLQTFAGALNYNIADFAKLGLFAKNPVELGSRCTVFMNSSVKQAQKDGATIDNISAGLSMSVVKNAIYKVIRATTKDAAVSLGKHIVVQGGTFFNDAVLRAFEKEIGMNVVRPDIAGLMGAYGAALYAKAHAPEKSSILQLAEIESFVHEVKAITCKGCTNNCKLTVNTFGTGENKRRFIAGNRCDTPVTGKKSEKNELNLYDYKLSLLNELKSSQGGMGRIGIPLGLNMYELLPFWHTLLTELGFEVVVSPASNRKLYLKGQQTIPSDTVCFPAKLLHGHIEELIEAGVDKIFYPCLTYNINEGLGDNHYNCPVVAYYPEVIRANVRNLDKDKFICDYFGIHRPKDFARKFAHVMNKHFDNAFTLSQVKNATEKAYKAYENYLAAVRAKGKEYIDAARKAGKPIIVLAGRPYHIDPEVNHGIDKLICNLGAAVITEDSISAEMEKFKVSVLNQWTYHARLYAAAKYIADKKDMNLVQLVSFGCGVDAITTDETRAILESENKIYTQIKIDEITNLGAVKIRLRSLFSAI
ncbi:MAG: 2-hydroxyglutaryl-CoA dehydratase [Ruminococcaceae bacterium]|nr:2-hydroxyglutaryl-CoA dehydratase [Oscillospiraceae bacterium]